MAVAVEVGELMDQFRWVPNGRAPAALDDAHVRAGVEDEAVDVVILLLEFASVCGIDIARAVERNAPRYPVEFARGRGVKWDSCGTTRVRSGLAWSGAERLTAREMNTWKLIRCTR